MLVLGLLALAAGILTSCDHEEQRAVPPGAVRDIVTAVSEDGDESVDPDASGGFIERPVLDAALPPAKQIYFTHGADIWRAPLDDEPEAVTRSEAVTSFSSSATGDRVAILRIERDEVSGAERNLPSIRLPDGNRLFDLAELDDTVDLDDMSPIESIALTPSGDALAATHRNGAVSMVTTAGEISQLVEPGEERYPGLLAWSSDGRFLTYIDPWMPDQPSALYLVIPEREARQILVEPPAEGQGVVQATWIPGSSSIVYIRTSGSTIRHGGDVFVVDATTGEQRLLFSSSEIAPVAGVVDLAVSPDGETVALSGFVPGDDRPDFAGLWLLDLTTGDHEEVNDVERPVTDLWWLGDDLTFRTIDEPRTDLPGTYTGQESFGLFSYDRESGELNERYAFERPSDNTDDEELTVPDQPIINR